MDGSLFSRIKRVSGGLQFDVYLDLPVYEPVDDWRGVFLSDGKPIIGSEFRVVRGRERTLEAFFETSSTELPSTRMRIYNSAPR